MAGSDKHDRQRKTETLVRGVIYRFLCGPRSHLAIARGEKPAKNQHRTYKWTRQGRRKTERLLRGRGIMPDQGALSPEEIAPLTRTDLALYCAYRNASFTVPEVAAEVLQLQIVVAEWREKYQKVKVMETSALAKYGGRQRLSESGATTGSGAPVAAEPRLPASTPEKIQHQGDQADSYGAGKKESLQ